MSPNIKFKLISVAHFKSIENSWAELYDLNSKNVLLHSRPTLYTQVTLIIQHQRLGSVVITHRGDMNWMLRLQNFSRLDLFLWVYANKSLTTVVLNANITNIRGQLQFDLCLELQKIGQFEYYPYREAMVASQIKRQVVKYWTNMVKIVKS